MAAAAKTIAVTGASRGIGLAVARYLVGNGHNVVVSARSECPLEEFRAKYPKQVRTIAGEITDSALGEQIVQVVEKEFSRLDGLVINHGLLEPVERIADANVDEWRKNFDVNLFSSLHLLKATIPLLRKSKGRVILTSSGAGLYGSVAWGPYCTSKAALKMLGEVLEKEEESLIVVSVRPGVVDTQMQVNLRTSHFAKMDAQSVKKFTTMLEQGSMLKPEQPGNVIARLALDAPEELSGKFVQWNSPEVSEFQD